MREYRMDKRVLFVDNDPHTLEGFQRILFPLMDQWELVFVDSSDAALGQLKEAPFNVIIADLRLPKMDGLELLSHVKDLYPEVIRIILTAHAERQESLRAAAVGHQFLLKPCN